MVDHYNVVGASSEESLLQNSACHSISVSRPKASAYMVEAKT
jgi:hypothetical protein